MLFRSAKIAALEARIAELEEQLEETTSEEAITCELKTWGDIAVSAGATTLDTTFKLTLTNTTADDLEDVIFTLAIRNSPALTLKAPPVATLTGGYTSWALTNITPTYAIFQNGWGFDVDANSTGKMMLALHLEFEPTTQPTWFEVEVELEDYDIK